MKVSFPRCRLLISPAFCGTRRFERRPCRSVVLRRWPLYHWAWWQLCSLASPAVGPWVRWSHGNFSSLIVRGPGYFSAGVLGGILGGVALPLNSYVQLQGKQETSPRLCGAWHLAMVFGLATAVTWVLEETLVQETPRSILTPT